MTSERRDRLDFVERMLSGVLRWAEREPMLRGMALVGSYARGTPREDSDVDVVLLAESVESFLSLDWLCEIEWPSLGVSPESCRFVRYGATWSNHVRLDNGLEVEFGFAPLSWPNARPIDIGTRQVISDGCRVLYDPHGLFVAACSEVWRDSGGEIRAEGTSQG